MFPGRRLERDLIIGAEVAVAGAVARNQRERRHEQQVRQVVAAETMATANAVRTTAAVNAAVYGQPGYGTPGYGTPGYGTPGYGTPGYGTPGYGTAAYGTPGYVAPLGVGVGGVGMGAGMGIESRPFKLQAEQTGMMVTVRQSFGTLGEHGVLTPQQAEPMNVMQQFRWDHCEAFPGHYIMQCVSNPNHVVRFTPRHPSGNLHVWNREPGSPLQAWRVNGHHIHPHGHPEMHFNINERTMHYHVSHEPQRFRILYI